MRVEKAGNGKKRDTVGAFLIALKSKTAPEKLCAQANHIIHMLNEASRNLLSAHASPNQAIKQRDDPHLVASTSHPGNLAPVKYSENIYTYYKILNPLYAGREVTVNGEKRVQSSSVSAKKDESFIALPPEADGTYRTTNNNNNNTNTTK